METLEVPFCDVHLSDISRREDFRKINVLDGLSLKALGKKQNSYFEAVSYIIQKINHIWYNINIEVIYDINEWFKTGLTIMFDNNIYQIIEFMHVKPGKGSAFVRTKIRNLRTGSIIDHTFAGFKLEKLTLKRIRCSSFIHRMIFCILWIRKTLIKLKF